MKPTTNVFSCLKSCAALILVALVTFGCQREDILPETNAPTQHFAGESQIVHPDNQCGSSAFATMVDGAGTIGTVEIANNPNDLYLIMQMEPMKFITELKIYIGDASSMPLDAEGNLLLEKFDYQYRLNMPTDQYTFTAPKSSIHACNDIVVWARIESLNMFGQVTGTTESWMSGTAVANGYTTNYCMATCP